MIFRTIFSVVSLTLVLCGMFVAGHAGAKPVMVHYMPWFESQPYSGYWGWHWTMASTNINIVPDINPNIINTNSEREVATWYYPLIGAYDSADPAALEYHVLLMKLAGIDGVIVDWYGIDNFDDYVLINQRTADLFSYTRKAGLKFSLCYEDATIGNEINGGFITAANATNHAQQAMLYAQTNYFTDPSYLHWNNMPVLLNFGPQYFKNNAQWVSIFSVLNATNQPALFTEDNRLSVGQGAFDWPPMLLSQSNIINGEGVLTDYALQWYLSNFEQKAAFWPAFVSTVFPRFHDYYAQAGTQPSYGYRDDENGTNLIETLSRAMTNASAIVQIATWNDFGEGTIVEPTVGGSEPTTEYGYADLGIIQDLRRLYLDAGFPYHTNDLALAARLFNLRELYLHGTTNLYFNATNGSYNLFVTANPVVSAELDRVFSNIISGNLTVANLQLTGIESNVPVIYNLSLTNNQLQFFMGGYLSTNGIQIETSTNLATWETNSALPVNTNQAVFNTSVLPADTPLFFRVKND
jgi:hypothetical protein